MEGCSLTLTNSLCREINEHTYLGLRKNTILERRVCTAFFYRLLTLDKYQDHCVSRKIKNMATSGLLCLMYFLVL